VPEGAAEVNDEVVGVVRAICGALPETTERHARGEHGVAYSFDVRRRSFCLLIVADAPADATVPILLFCASPDEREVYLATGHPFFEPRHEKKVGLVLGDAPDWKEIRELITDSYCLLAPKKLVTLLISRPRFEPPRTGR
jgi:hypothetical protein